MAQQTLGGKIRDGRLSIGLTQRALADRMHADPISISRWERDAGFPSVPSLLTLALMLDLDLGDLDDLKSVAA